jgi:chaperonin cofactor prefoldin
MDDTLTVGGSTTIESSPAAETTAPDQSAGGGQAAPENNQTEGGQSQDSTESGQSQQGGKRKWSMQDEVRELRAQRRELREQVSRFDDVRNELAQLREEMSRQRQAGTAKTGPNFWQDPEAVLEAKLEEKLERMQNNMIERFQTTREQEYAERDRQQETQSAAEFIRSQPGYDSSDDEDLIEIIQENNLASLGPTKAANVAWALLQQSRGIGDRGLAKRQAASVQGQPPGVGFGRKMWNKADFDQAVDMVESKMRANPNDPKMNELFNELMAAHKEGRVK